MSDENTYVIADSETELARLQLQGSLLDEAVPLFPQLFQPEEHPHAKILDLGCGPGTWITQVAHKHPSFQVTAIDVNPRMVAYARATAEVQELEVEFSVMDILQPFTFEDETFDLVNLRFGAGFIPRAKAPAVFQECWRVLQPGGVMRNIESVHTSMPTSSPHPHALARFIFQALYMAGMTYNREEISLSAGTARIFQDIGFHPIDLAPAVLDISAGAMFHDAMYDDMRIGATLLKPFVVDQMHMCSSEDFDTSLKEVERLWQDPRFSAHWYVCSVSGMKPGVR